MRLASLKPARGEGLGITGGLFLCLVLHVFAFIAVGIIGKWLDPREGELFVVPFLAVIGFAQWAYIGPAAWFLQKREWTASAKGLRIGGVALTVLMVLAYSASALIAMRGFSESRRIAQTEAEHPHDYISTDGVVTVVDDKHFEFKRDDNGEVVSLLTWQGLDYVFLKANGGYEKRTRDILKPDVRVSVDYSQERGKPPLDASIVRVYEEGAHR